MFLTTDNNAGKVDFLEVLEDSNAVCHPTSNHAKNITCAQIQGLQVNGENVPASENIPKGTAFIMNKIATINKPSNPVFREFGVAALLPWFLMCVWQILWLPSKKWVV